MSPVTVRYRGRRDELVARGERREGVVGFRWGWTEDGRDLEQVSFLLLDECFLLAQPVDFDVAQRGWWYCDLVSVDDRGDTVHVEDLYVDVVVGPPTTAYRLLDLDELAAAVTTGAVAADTALSGLASCQRFLDRRLNRRHDTTPTWPDFPPAEVATEHWTTLPADWWWRPLPSRDG